jgi:hypothetical protein
MTATTRRLDETDRTLGKGHGTEALGPSNSSDTGSDVASGDAGALLGDTDLSADSDAEGTGERAAAGRDDSQPPSRDVSPDREAPADDPSLGLTDGPQRADGTTVDSEPDPLDEDASRNSRRQSSTDVERGSGPER